MSGEPPASHVKVLFEVEQNDGGVEIESMWAVPTGHGYRLDNIPFFVTGYAVDDIVSATPDPDGGLRCTGLVESSGHSTVRLVFFRESDLPAVREELRARGCGSELDRSGLVSVDVPPSVPYARIRSFLDEKQQAGILDFEEACLGQDEG